MIRCSWFSPFFFSCQICQSAAVKQQQRVRWQPWQEHWQQGPCCAPHSCLQLGPRLNRTSDMMIRRGIVRPDEYCFVMFRHALNMKMMEDDGRCLGKSLQTRIKRRHSFSSVQYGTYRDWILMNLTCADITTYDNRSRNGFLAWFWYIYIFWYLQSPPGFARHLQRFWWHPILQGKISKSGLLWWGKIDSAWKWYSAAGDAACYFILY